MRRVTDRNTGRKSSKAKRVFEKVITMHLVGGDEKELNRVANKIYKADIKEIRGGQNKRTVQMTHESTKPKQIFLGRI